MYSRTAGIGNRLWEREARCLLLEKEATGGKKKRKKSRTGPVVLE